MLWSKFCLTQGSKSNALQEQIKQSEKHKGICRHLFKLCKCLPSPHAIFTILINFIACKVCFENGIAMAQKLFFVLPSKEIRCVKQV